MTTFWTGGSPSHKVSSLLNKESTKGLESVFGRQRKKVLKTKKKSCSQKGKRRSGHQLQNLEEIVTVWLVISEKRIDPENFFIFLEAAQIYSERCFFFRFFLILSQEKADSFAVAEHNFDWNLIFLRKTKKKKKNTSELRPSC